MKIITTKNILTALIGMSSTILFSQAPTPSDIPQATTIEQEKIRVEMSQLESEFREVAGKLQKLEQKALEEDGVAEARDNFNELLRDKIVDIKPDLESKVEERAELSEYIDDYKAGKELPDGKDVAEVFSKYNSLHQEIMPVEQQVMQEQEVQQAFRSFQQQLLTTMQSIDEKAQEYMNRQNELRESYQELQQKIEG